MVELSLCSTSSGEEHWVSLSRSDLPARMVVVGKRRPRTPCRAPPRTDLPTTVVEVTAKWSHSTRAVSSLSPRPVPARQVNMISLPSRQRLGEGGIANRLIKLII